MPEECRSASRIGSHDDWRSEDPNIPKSPWWHTSSPALGVGFRLIRPFEVPKTDAEKNKFWDADIASIMDDVSDRIETHGKGAYGTVDPDLPKDIEKQKK